jgi:hypothetical protein
MVFRRDDKGGGWHEPPYTWEEEMDLYRRMSPKPGTPMTIYRGPKKAADKPAPQEPPQEESDRDEER